MSNSTTPTPPEDGRPDYDRTWFVHDEADEADDNDRVFRRPGEGWFCVVNGCEFGAWRSRAEAMGGLRVEQRRATCREWEPRSTTPTISRED